MNRRVMVILGRGRMGSALRHSLPGDVALRASASPGPRPRRSVAWVLAVTDRALEGVSASLRAFARPGDVALHLAGARGPEALAPLSEMGVAVASLHPLVAVSSKRREPSLRGAPFSPRPPRCARPRCWCAELGRAARRHPRAEGRYALRPSWRRGPSRSRRVSRRWQARRWSPARRMHGSTPLRPRCSRARARTCGQTRAARAGFTAAPRRHRDRRAAPRCATRRASRPVPRGAGAGGRGVGGRWLGAPRHAPARARARRR